MRLKFVFWLFLFTLFALGCARYRPYTAPVIPQILPDSLAGQTVCAWNNLPLAFVQPQYLDHADGVLIIAHEQKHADDMFNYKGGCWPYYYRYRSDIKFKIESEYRAYCTEGKLALERNKNPIEIWQRIKKALLDIDAVLGSKKPNCIYEER